MKVERLEVAKKKEKNIDKIWEIWEKELLERCPLCIDTENIKNC